MQKKILLESVSMGMKIKERFESALMVVDVNTKKIISKDLWFSPVQNIDNKDVPFYFSELTSNINPCMVASDKIIIDATHVFRCKKYEFNKPIFNR